MPVAQIKDSFEDQVYGTLDEIKESVVFMSNQQVIQQPAKNVLQISVFKGKNQAQQDPSYSSTATLKEDYGRTDNVSKNDNKDSKNMLRKITKNEFQTNQQNYNNQMSFQSRQDNKFEDTSSQIYSNLAKFSASQQAIVHRDGGLTSDFRQESFRSPLAQPGGKLHRQKNSITEGSGISKVQAAEILMKKALQQNQNYYERLRSNQKIEDYNELTKGLESNIFEEERSDDQTADHRFTYRSNQDVHSQNLENGATQDTANFFTAKGTIASSSMKYNSNTKLPQSLHKSKDQPQLNCKASATKKSHAELQREFLEVQRKLQMMKKTQPMMIKTNNQHHNKQSMLTVIPKSGQPTTDKQLQRDDTNNSQYFFVPQNSQTITRGQNFFNNREQNISITQLDESLCNKILPVSCKFRADATNLISTRLNSKNQHKAGKFEVDSSEQKNQTTYRGQSQNNDGSYSLLNRQGRMSARPYTHHNHKKNLQKLGNGNRNEVAHSNESPVEQHSLGLSNLKNRRSPALKTQQLSHQEVKAYYNKRDLHSQIKTKGTKNSKLVKPGEMRVRNARTFIDDGSDMVSKSSNNLLKHHQKQHHHHNKSSMLSTGAQRILLASSTNEQFNVMASKSMRGNTQLQALSEFRHRENQTVQTGQVILRHQRIRDGGSQYFVESHSKHQQQKRQINQTSSRNNVQMRSVDLAGGVQTRSVQRFQNTINTTEPTEDENLKADVNNENIHGEEDVLSQSKSRSRDHSFEFERRICRDEYGDKFEKDDHSGSISSKGVARYRGIEDYAGQIKDQYDHESYDQEQYSCSDEGADPELEDSANLFQAGNGRVGNKNNNSKPKTSAANLIKRNNIQIKGGFSKRNPNFSASSEDDDYYDENTSNRRMTTGCIPKEMKSHSPPGQRRRIKWNDSQKHGGGTNRQHNNSMRQRSPINSKSQYQVSNQVGSQHQKKRSNAFKLENSKNYVHLRSHLLQDSSQKGIKPGQRQKLESHQNIKIHEQKQQNDNQQQHSSRKHHRNQQMKINSNMTGGSGTYSNPRQDTVQSSQSANQATQHQSKLAPYSLQHPHLIQQPKQIQPDTNGYVLNNSQPDARAVLGATGPYAGGQMFYPYPQGSGAASVSADPSQQFYLLQQQQQQAQMVVNQMAAAHHAQNYLPPSLNNPLTNNQTLPIQIHNQPLPQHQMPASRSQSQSYQQQPTFESMSTVPFLNSGIVESAKEEEDVNSGIQEEIKKPILIQQKTNYSEIEQVQESIKPVIIPEMRKKQTQQDHHLQDEATLDSSSSNAIQKNKTADTDAHQDTAEVSTKKKGEAFIFGLEVDENEMAFASKNPFANKPVLRSKRSGAATQKKQLNDTGKPTANSSEYIEETANLVNSIPLGADYKKITVEQIQAREQRLKNIKNKGLIQIFDVDEGTSKNNDAAPVNISEAFAAKRRAKKVDDDNLDQDLAIARDKSQVDGQRNQTKKVEKVQKTPQELAQIRKAMMKKRHTTSAQEQATVDLQLNSLKPADSSQLQKNEPIVLDQKQSLSIGNQSRQMTKTPTQSVKEPNAALMERLAGGKRTTIDKKEMKKLTKYNYENLPEIKRRKDEERKKQEALEKKERIAKYNKECKARSRAQLKKKRDQAASVVQSAQTEEGKLVVGQPQELIVTKQLSSQTKRVAQQL